MISKKDVTNAALWTAITDVAFSSTFLIARVFIKDSSIVSELSTVWNVGPASIMGGIIKGRYLANMTNRYNEQEFKYLKYAVLGVTATTMGLLNIYNMTSMSDVDMTSYIITGGFSSIGATFESFFTVEAGMEGSPLKLPDIVKSRKEKADSKLKEVLSYDDSQDKDIFKSLERYNKVYKKTFTTLGTPYEMAKMTNNKKATKEIVEKNNQLILQGLLLSKVARDNVRTI